MKTSSTSKYNTHIRSRYRLKDLRHHWRKTLVLLMFAFASLTSSAALIQDEEGNYVIATKDDFIELMTKNTYWRNHHSFTQIADIDLEGQVLTPIGNTTTPFTGVYEGNGHTLKNAVMYWNNTSCYNYGIFGYICGPLTTGEYASVRNLNIENVNFTRQEDIALDDLTGNDVKIGVLAGQLCELVKIHDICIIDCQITDNDQPARVKACMAGGLAGDLYKHKDDGTSPVTADELTIKNIYCQVDIKLDKIVNANNDQQFLVGGILGRMRYPTLLSQLPDNTVFTGTITAPRASISPTVANIRGKSNNNFNTLVKTYAGELTSTLLKDAIGSQSAYNDFVSTRLFYDYQIYNSSAAGENKIEKITDTYPSVEPTDGKYAYGTRTLAPNANNNGTVFTSGWSNNSDSNWPRVQGINWADYTNPVTVETDRTRITDMLTNGREQEEVQTCHWEWDLGNNSCKLVNDNDLKFLKVYLENDVENNVYRVKYGYKDAFIPYPGTVEGDIQWYSATSIQNNDWTPIPGATGMTIPANKSLFFRVEVSYNGITITSDYIAPYRRIYVYNPESNARYNEDFADDVYKFNADNNPIYANAGRDINDGLTPETAVLTMAEAFKKLNEYGSVKTNTIVTMGYYTDDDYLFVPNPDVLLYNKPATITGTDNDKITNGILGLKKLNGSPKAGTKATAHFLYLQAPLRFDNIAIMSQWYKVGARKDNGGNSHATDGGFIVCNYFDLTIDENVRIVNFLPVSSTNGLAGNITSLPFISIIGGTQDMDLDATQFPIRYGNEKYPDHPGFYTTPNATTITVRSGAFGRIICCCRNEYVNGVSHNITGTPDIPNRIRLNVNIKNDIDFSDPNHQYSMYGDTLHWENNKLHYVSARYSHNIGLISGGQTDGSAYGDIIMNVYAGHISRIITSNITFGRDVDVKDKNNVVTAYYPSDSFWGRSILNIYGNTQTQADGTITSETTINEVFGGMLGRISSAPDNAVCRPYFYGKSVINMYGGYIGYYTGNRTDNGLSNLKTTVPNLYGVGSGGVTGLGYDEDHCTTDKAIPFINNQGKVSYGVFSQAKGNMPKMTMLDGEEIDLEIAKCEVNIYSGMILGSVYGGGYGYSSSLEKYSGVWVYQKAPGDLGVLYGDSKVTMYRHPDFQPPVVLGNIYGSGRGTSFYAEHFHEAAPDETENRFLGVAAQYGNTQVIISDGTIGNPKADPNDPSQDMGGNVYAGSQGVKGYQNIAALYGSTNLIIEGGTIYGNIYGGSEIANIHKHPSIENSGNTHVTINGGTIGNNIFGGSQGIDKDLVKGETADAKAIIDGDTHLTINGGDFLGWPYIDLRAYVDPSKQTPVQLNSKLNIVDNRDQYRTFNIYGGGYMNCDIQGTANLKVYTSLLHYEESLANAEENPNAIPDPKIQGETTFHKHYMDLTYRNFCVYGGGFGEKTNVLNTDVYITIPRYRQHVTKPHGETLESFLDHQSFFDLCGGGYSGDVGHWVTGQYAKDTYDIEIGTPVNNLKINSNENDVFADFKEKVKAKYPTYSDDEIQSEIVKLYDHYEQGNCKIVIDDYTFTRKVIGGGFYGSCKTTDTHVRCGSLCQVYGGSLLGYVHDRASLQFGNRIEDFARWKPDPNDPTGENGQYVYSETEEYLPFKGDFDNLKDNFPEVYASAAAFAKELNDNIFITEHIYGGNDVKGIIGTQFWEDPMSTEEKPIYGVDPTDGGPLFCANIDSSEEKGIVFTIYGGTFMGNVYSAGNGHYRGYFVPEWVRYNDGPARMYRSVISSVKDANGNFKLGKAYRSRPMVGSVNINLRGNSDDDHITILGNFFGGGRECTIGQFNTILPIEDPRRLVAGGHLHVNIGGYTHVQGNVYLGAEGELYASQQCLPQAINLKTFDGSTNKELAKLGNAAYDHWYFDTEEQCYLPGYPAPGKVDGNFGMYGEHMLSSYMQNVQIQGDVELTFYRFLYERDDKGYFKYRTFSDGSQNRIRRHWIPGEIALDKYDAPSVVMNSFFLGGLSGSMTNNNVMLYEYPDSDPYPGYEKWGCIYRVVLPEGVTVRDKVVMGSENATIDIYPYNEDFTDVIKNFDAEGQPTNRLYSYEGGLITQHTFTYDLIALNDRHDKDEHYVENIDEDFYNPEGTNYATDADIRNSKEYELTRGEGGTIYRYNYQTQYLPGTKETANEIIIPYLNSRVLNNGRYSLAHKILLNEDGTTVKDGNENPVISAYIGPREFRTPSDLKEADDNDLAVVTKLTLACKFDQRVTENAPDPNDHKYHYGGNVYGGCYNSGVVIGDVVLNIGSNLLGEHIDQSMDEAFNDYSTLKYNIGRVFGGGFGKQTLVEGDIYVNLLRNFRGMNVFGGGMMGNVKGRTHITYIGKEDESFVFGGIYGGGLQGNVGDEGKTKQATTIRLFSGNVERVFGGSCMGNLYGRAYVELCDQITTDKELDYHLAIERLGYDKWASSRLIAGKVFGGNDIAGNIYLETIGFLDEEQGSQNSQEGSGNGEPGEGNGNGNSGNGEPSEGNGESGNGGSTAGSTQQNAEQFEGFSTCVWIHEEANSKKNSPGSIGGYNGFPLIGDLYGGSNGSYGVHGNEGIYLSGTVTMATGNGIETEDVPLMGRSLPHIEKSHLLIEGGSVINAYGGGDKCDITDEDKITVKYPTDAVVKEARAGFESQEDLNRVWKVLRFSSDQQQSEVLKRDDQGHPVFKYQICRLFGGNNNADMAIQPTWVLKSGFIGSLYSGGNFGKMTYYEPPKAAVAAHGEEGDDDYVPAQPAVKEKGLTLTINSYDLEINNVYGGGRLGDIDPETTVNGVSYTPSPEFYGATLNIERGIIDHVYGGNDVSGYVMYGTNVNLKGAISGDVYCAGNGNYLYQYDRHGQMYDYDSYFVQDQQDENLYNFDSSTLKIQEDFSFETDQFNGTRFFKLPAKTDFGLEKGVKYNASDALTIMAINSYRPHVQRTKLYIEGQEDNKVWVRGNVYCGGNSASVVTEPDSQDYDVIFDIGSHVILNGVFLGSNGSSLAMGDMIKNTEKLNADKDGRTLNMVGPNDLQWEETTDAGTITRHIKNKIDKPAVLDKATLYPTVLDLYMRAVETTETPKAFDPSNPKAYIFDPNIFDSYIGEFCVGGNRGSMLTSKCIDLTFPSSITIFGRIIGGCKNADVTYNGITHIGGLTKPLASGETTKVDLKVKSKFRPLNLLFPDVNSTPPISIHNVIVDHDGNPWNGTGDKYYLNQQCNVYGGCFTSGTTIGDIKLDIYSDMLNYDGPAKVAVDPNDENKGVKDNPEYIDKQAVINGVQDTRSWRAFTVVGGGYGAKTAVYGNIDVRMLPEVTGTGKDRKVTHPSAATIFGGSQEGLVVGNTNVEIRDGKILANVYGASEAAKMYGSTSVIVGYPKYYKAKKTGNYHLRRVDFISETSRYDLKDEFDEIVVPKTVAYYKGDIVPDNVYSMIDGRVKNSRIKTVLDSSDPNFRVGKNVERKYVDNITFNPDDADAIAEDDLSTSPKLDTPVTYYMGDLFEPVEALTKNALTSQPIADHIVPEDFGATWDDITIWIGDQSSNLDPINGVYYGQGNVYGGGYVPNTTDRALVGSPTVMRFTPKFNNGRVVDEFKNELQTMKDAIVGLYGGNTAVMIWDDPRCAEINTTTGEYRYSVDPDSEDKIEEHVHIGAGYFKQVAKQLGESAKGFYEKVDKTISDGSGGTTTETAYIYITSGKVEKDNNDNVKTYYEKIADGGVYGGGRKVFAEGFRSIDLAYYGYAGHSPQRPKLLNTIQRADVATVTDCCIDLVGASDFTVNDYKGIYYAINRVGELRMYTSLRPDKALDRGYTDDTDGISIHSKKRSRNYIALYNKTNHLGALLSDWAFDEKYHDALGVISTKNDSAYGYPTTGANASKESYVNHKHRYIDFYKDYAALRWEAEQAEANNSEVTFTKTDVDVIVNKYNTFNGLTDSDQFSYDTTGKTVTDYLKAIGDKMRDTFAERNVGTSGNMIGISSGYELSFEGLSCKEGTTKETKYYGPAYGVTEMKLLTTVSGMGGGYVYALNHHFENTDPVDIYFKYDGQDFLQTTGNFVFPGASYHSTSDNEDRHNFLVDDCFDYTDINHGYYECPNGYVDAPDHNRDVLLAPVLKTFNVNDPHEIHYWYVSGDTYTFNVTLTAFTSDDPIREFTLSNDNDRINLFNVKPGTQITVEEVNWFVHNAEDINNGFSCDITHTEQTGEGDDKKEYFDKKYKLYLTLSNDPQNQLTESSSSADRNGAYVIRLPRYTYEAGESTETNKIVNAIVEGNIDDSYDVQADSEGNKFIDPNYYLNDDDSNNNFFGIDSNGNKITDIKPRLGLRLVDEQPNRLSDKTKEESQDYYNKHLKPVHSIQVKLETRSPNSKGELGSPIYYIINIDLKYLMGPAVYGNIQIENCALPGEYIYVNANDVEVVMDPELGVAEQSWRLYPNDENGKPFDDEHYTITDPDIKTDSKGYLYYDMGTPEFADGDYEEITVNNVTTEEFVITNEKLLHIPAYYYQNGWNPVFTVKANGEDFQCSLPFYDKKEVTKPDPNNEGQTITTVEDDTTKPHPENRLQIHNYHRMKPVYTGNVTDNVKNLLFNEISYEEDGDTICDGSGDPIVLSKVIDLRLVPGARIYLESQEDMRYFFEYLFQMQNTTAPQGYKRFDIKYKGDPIESDPDKWTTITTINPEKCEGLNFYQQKTLNVPAKEYHHGDDPHIFKGLYHGNGNWMEIPDGDHINMVNKGYLFNTGFVSHVANNNTIIYNDNTDGYIVNSFYFNQDEKGVLATNGKLVNCYQNTELKDPNAFKYNELMKISTNGFRYGQVAYNLNGFYLQKRHMLLHEPYGSATKPDNNPYALNQRDVDLRSDASLTYDDYLSSYSVKYIEDMFNNGDYRYALYYKPLESQDYLYTQFTEALRMADEPNYFDIKSNRTNNEPVSMHNYDHPIDEARWCETHQVYHPIFDKDYFFFGEDLSVDLEVAEEKNHLPEAYHPENRVYRVGGFYGSAADKGYYMNRKVYLDTPLMTAIDFVGYRDRDMYNADGTLKGAGTYNGTVDDYSVKVDPEAYDYKGHLKYDGWVICKGWHEVFMAPTLDLPWTLEDPTKSMDMATNKPIHDFSSFEVNSNKVTHNLLIYTEDLKEANDVLAQFHYGNQINFSYGQTDEYAFATHSDAGIKAHHIVDDGTGPVMAEGYFHLVDKHDFNAPVEFKTQHAWYNRMPEKFCQEFIRTNNKNEEEVYKDGWEGICLPFDVGQVYAASTDNSVMRDMGEITHFFGDQWHSHEYWLRRLATSSPVSGQLCFERPTSENRQDNREAVAGEKVNPDDAADQRTFPEYMYTNTAIYDLYKDFHYDESNVTIKVDGKDYTHDLLYHSEDDNTRHSRKIENYRYLSRSMPYIVTFPGKDFYEFDLSGEFYAEKLKKYNNTIIDAVPQTMCYLAMEDAPDQVTIHITDEVPLISYTQEGFTMKGTFMHVTDNDALSKSVLYEKVDYLSVLDGVKVVEDNKGNPIESNEVHHGFEFVRNNDNMVVLPFRTYLVGNSSSPSDIPIGSRSINPDEEIVEEPEPELPQAIDAEREGIKVWVEGQKLVIKTPYDLTTTIFDMSGRPVRHIKAYEGTNRYSGLDQGFYIVLRTKFAIL